MDRAAERSLVVGRDGLGRRPARSVRVAITAAGRALIDQGAADLEAEIAVLVADLTPAQRARLSVIASRIVAADARAAAASTSDPTSAGDGLSGPRSARAGVASEP